LKDIFNEMVAIAWHPVSIYRLSLGKQDKLQEAVLEVKKNTTLTPEADTIVIRETIGSSPELSRRLFFLERFVPTRFLSPWFSKQLRGKKDHVKDSMIKSLSRESQNTSSPTPYYFDETSPAIRFNESWRMFILENLGVIQSFAEYHFALYLQIRNPNVPGIISKLRAPTKRQLTTARNYWRFVRQELSKHGWEYMFKDIYSQNQLSNDFSIDHFLPWSFVVHDQLWNLAPVEKSTNSKKGDMLPDLEIYLPRLAELHYKAIEVALNRPKLLEDYITCFNEEPPKLLSLGMQGLLKKYHNIIVPQTQIAINQGFQAGWVYRN